MAWTRRKYTDGRACFQRQADAREAVMVAARRINEHYTPFPVTLARLVNAVNALDAANAAVAEFTGRRAQIASVRDKPRERIRVR